MNLLLLLPVLALAGPFDAQRLIREFTAETVEGLDRPTPEARLPLPQLLNRYMKTSAAFKTPAGNAVYVSGGRSDGDFYLLLAPDKGKVVVLDAMTLLYAKQEAEVNGEKVVIDVDLNLLKQRKSRVQFYGAGKKLLGQFLIDDIVSAAYNAGADLTIGGKPFKFTYGNKVVRAGSKLAFGSARFLSFLHRDGDKIAAFTITYDQLAKGTVTLDVGAAVLKLKLDGDTLVVDD